VFLFVAGLVGFLLVVAWTETRDAERASRPQRERLARLLAERQRQTSGLESRLAELRAELDRASRGGAQLGRLRDEARRLDLLAGRAAIEGPGVTVELKDGELAASPENGSDYRIQDIDLQLVVNELWAAGAEAIAVNGQRIVTSTAIRSAGGAVLVNFRVLTSPYRVNAVGDSDRLAARFGASEVASRLRRWGEIYGLGMSVRKQRALKLPAYDGAVRFRYATPVEPE
jgi:uncharacterized protein YlxW (UPF0749 family)